MLKKSVVLPFHCLKGSLLVSFLLVFENNENTEHALKVVEDKCKAVSGRSSVNLI